MRIFIASILLCGFYVFLHAKPPKEKPVSPYYLAYLNKLKDSVTYFQYLDSLMRSKDFCFRDDTADIIPKHELDSSAAYPEGTYAFLKFLQTHIQYPALARENGGEGKVIIKFLVDENGKACNPQVVRYAGWGMDEESIRVFKLVKQWKPGLKNGTPVKSYFIMPVTFKLQ